MKRYLAFLLICIFMFSILHNTFAFADPVSMTVFEMAGAAFALGQASGINFSFSDPSGDFAASWMENKINSWLAGDSILDKVGAGQLQMIAGKLVIPAAIYSGIKDFVDWLVDDLQLSTTDTVIDQGEDGNINIGVYYPVPSGEIDPSSIGCSVVPFGNYYEYDNIPDVNGNIIPHIGGYNKLAIYYNGESLGTLNAAQSTQIFINWWVASRGNRFYVYGYNRRPLGGATQNFALPEIYAPHNVLSGYLDDDYDLPVVNPGYRWEGEVQDAPDTNLEDLLEDIFDQTQADIIVVDGEVVEDIDPPIPPEPIAPDTPLQDVPWEGLNDLIGSSSDAITEAQDATTEAVESLSDIVEGALDTPSAEDLPDFKFDLRELFPFCIPFDIYRLLSSFDAEPQAPHVQIPIVIESLNFRYILDLDFSSWNPVAQAMRNAELIVYAIGLAWATRKVIKW